MRLHHVFGSAPVQLTVGVTVFVLLLGWHGAYAETQQTGTTLTGKVIFEGPKPKRKVIRMMADPRCAAQHSKRVRSERVIVNKNGTLRNVVVYLKSGFQGEPFETPAQPVILDQVGCIYKPHVFAAQAGQPVRVRNSDPTLHNVHGYTKKNKPFNFVQPVQGMENTLTFNKPEQALTIKCDVHPWMKTYGWVFDHPFFAVTDEDGAFTISGLPAGEYVIEAWHERYGTQNQRVAIAAQENKQIQFIFESKKKKKKKKKQ